MRARCRVLVCSRSLCEYLRRIWRPWACDWTWRSSASFRLAFICSWGGETGGQRVNVAGGASPSGHGPFQGRLGGGEVAGG